MHQEARLPRNNMAAVLTHRCDEQQWPVRYLRVSVVITVWRYDMNGAYSLIEPLTWQYVHWSTVSPPTITFTSQELKEADVLQQDWTWRSPCYATPVPSSYFCLSCFILTPRWLTHWKTALLNTLGMSQMFPLHALIVTLLPFLVTFLKMRYLWI